MKKISVMFTRPIGWEKIENDRMEMIYVPLAGTSPRRKTGRPAGDSALASATEIGINLLVAAMRARKPQVLIRGVNTKMTRRSLERVHRASPDTLVMCGDGNYPNSISPYFENHKDLIDVVLLNSKDPATKERYHVKGYAAETLYDGYDPQWFKSAPPAPVHFDCFFAGSNRRHKIQMKGGIINWKYDFPNGSDRFEFIGKVNSRFKLLQHGNKSEWPYIIRPTLYPPRYFWAFRKALMVLGYNHYDLHRYYTRRLFHSGGSGSLLVTRYIPGMEKDFENGKHLVWFKTNEEGIGLLHAYKKNVNDRKRIAVTQERHFRERHTWKARLKDVERLVIKHL